MTSHEVTVLYPYEEWCVTENSFDYESNYRDETIFALGNGYIGIRGCFEEGYSGPVGTSLEGTYINGFYDSAPIIHGEDAYGFARHRQTMLNVTDGKRIRLFLGEEEFKMTPLAIRSYKRTLDMKSGLLTREVLWESEGGKQVQVAVTRLVSFTRKHIAALRYTVTPINFDGTLRLVSSLEGEVYNQVTAGDPRVGSSLVGQVLKVEEKQAEGRGGALLSYTRSTRFGLSCAMEHEFPLTWQSSLEQGEQNISLTIEIPATRGTSYSMDKFIAYCSTKDFGASEVMIRSISEVQQARQDSFETLVSEQRSYLDEFWRKADVEIKGDDALQQGIRFNLFHLLQSVGKDGKTNIGAKGITGEGYEGHYFWDTEIFIQPVFLYTDPEITKRLLEYRYAILDAARARAKELSHKGALYAWRTIDGAETSAYFPAGTAQYHINADVMFALKKYIHATQDLQFLFSMGAEMLFETSRFWVDLGRFIPGKGFCIHTVTGPDEYTALVDNNAYTNYMAKDQLEFATEVVNLMKDQCPDRFAELCTRIGLTDNEISLWSRAAAEMFIKVDEERGIIAQDDSFLEKPVWDFQNTPPGHKPLMLYYHYLNIYRHQVLKQADVVMVQFLQGERFTLAQKKRCYDYYEPLTTHDSSLSCSVHSVIAAELGYEDKAYEYFMHSARMDLDDYHKNSNAGIHTACMAGSWMSIVNGFAGMRESKGELSFRPTLPKVWDGYSFKVNFRGKLLKVSVDKSVVCYTLEEGDSVEFRHFGSKVQLASGKTTSFSMTSELQGVIFDLDGVLTDTAEQHYQAWKSLAESLSIPFDREFNEQLKGVGRMESLDQILARKGVILPLSEKERLATEKNELYKSFVENISPKDLLPGIESLLKILRGAGVKMAVASASKNARPVLAKLGIEKLFDVIVDGTMVEKGKPDPECFLLAAELLQLPVRNCVGVEDAGAGLEAITSAGMKGIAVNCPSFEHSRVRHVASTEQLTLELLKKVVA